MMIQEEDAGDGPIRDSLRRKPREASPHSLGIITCLRSHSHLKPGEDRSCASFLGVSQGAEDEKELTILF